MLGGCTGESNLRRVATHRADPDSLRIHDVENVGGEPNRNRAILEKDVHPTVQGRVECSFEELDLEHFVHLDPLPEIGKRWLWRAGPKVRRQVLHEDQITVLEEHDL